MGEPYWPDPAIQPDGPQEMGKRSTVHDDEGDDQNIQAIQVDCTLTAFQLVIDDNTSRLSTMAMLHLQGFE